LDIRFIVLIIFAFIFEIFFLSKELRFKDNPISVKKVDIEFLNSQTYEIDKTKVHSILVCSKIQQVDNKKIFFNPVATLFDENITKNIISKEATLNDKTNILVLHHDINIIYSDKKLSTDMLKYNIKDAIITDSSNFTIKSENIVAKGDHLYFDTKNSIIKATDIDYKFYIKE